VRPDSDPEMSFLRAVEDCFAELRAGTHMLNQKEIHLAKKWWKEEIPFEAVRSGILEIIARRRAEGEDGVFGLAYCRHAVKRQAKLLAAMRSGTQESWQGDEDDPSETLRRLSRALKESAAALNDNMTEVAEVILQGICEIESLENTVNPVLDPALFHLETTLLSTCFEALPAPQREKILDLAEKKATASGAHGKALDRSRRVYRDKLIRELLSLPRFE